MVKATHSQTLVVLGSGGQRGTGVLTLLEDTWVWCLYCGLKTRNIFRISFLLNVSKPHGFP